MLKPFKDEGRTKSSKIVQNFQNLENSNIESDNEVDLVHNEEMSSCRVTLPLKQKVIFKI